MKTLLITLAAIAAFAITATAQSLLTEQPETEPQRIARELLLAPGQTRDVVLNQINDASLRIWQSPDPAAVLESLGTKAGPLLELNDSFATLVGNFLNTQGDADGLARLAEIQARIPAHTVHEDGTVTIDPEPTPTPTPTP